MTYRSAKIFSRILGWAGTAALVLAVFVASAPTTADAYAVNYINISYPSGCQILPGDSLQTCDIDPGGTLGPFTGTMDWQAGFPSPLPAMGMGSQTSYGYLPGTVPLGCTSSTSYPGATLGNSGVPTSFGGNQICEVAFNSASAGVGQGQYMFYASPSAVPGQRYYMHLSSYNPSPPVITPFYIRIRPAAVCNINSFTADNTTVGYNGSTNLRFTLSGNFAWNISTISGSGFANPSSGTSSSGVSSSGNLTNTTTYRLTCGPDSQDVTVVVPPAPVCSPNPASGNTGNGITLSASGGDGNYSWNTPNSSTSCSGPSCMVTYASQGIYNATVSSAGQSSTCSVNVAQTVLCGNGAVDPGEQCDGGNLNGKSCSTQGFTGGTLSCNSNCTFNTSSCTSSGTESISASKLSCSGSNATYNIRAVSTANNFYIKLIDSLGGTNIMTSMNEPVTSAGGRDYTTGPWVTNSMRFQLINASTGAVMAETNVGNTGCSSPSPTCSITASPNSGTGSATGNLSWNSTNATSCTASGGWSGAKATSGSQSYGTVFSSTTYSLSCTNGTTSGSCSASVNVGASTPKYLCGGASCIRDDINGIFTTPNCNNSCSVQRYGCSGSSCVANPTGPFTTPNCNNSCSVSLPVSCSPSFQQVSTGQVANFLAANGNGTYSWNAPGGNPSVGFNSLFSSIYSFPGNYSVMLNSNGSSAFCSVNVVTPPAQSDLTITDFHLTDAAGNTKATFLPTDSIYPSVTIRNNGSNPATPSSGYFYISIYSNAPGTVNINTGSDVSVWAKEVGSIPAFGSKTYSVTSNSANWSNDGSNRINWTKGVGSYMARAFVDSFNQVTEINEGNNQIASSYSVSSVLVPPAPNLKVTVWTDTNRNVVWGGYNGVDGPVTVPAQSSYALTWGSVANATACTLDGTAVSVSGGTANTYNLPTGITPTNPKVHTLSCSGPGGSGTDTVVLRVPPPPTLPTGLCLAPGSNGTISWTAPAGYNTFYVRAVDLANSSVYVYYKDGFVGTSVSFATQAGHTYSWWVHTEDPNGAWSEAVGTNMACAAAVCPAGAVTVSPASVLINQTSTASAPAGWSAGSYNSSNSGVASVAGSVLTGKSQGIANITGFGWTAPNGATNCSLTGTNLTVSQPARPTISLSPTSFTFNGVSGQANPGTQSLRISNTGNATLNWTSGGVPGKPGAWCSVSPASGSVAAGGQQNVAVTVSNPSNVGTFNDCGIRISDPTATNNPQDVSVTYVVIAPPATCPAGQVNLASASIIKGTTTTASSPAGWSAGGFSSSNAAVASVSGPTVTGVDAGTANITGGGWTAPNGATNCALAARGVTVTNIPPPGGTGAGGGSFCRQVVINWVDNSIGEQGFKIYRNTNNDPASASLITPAPNFIPSTSSNATGGSYTYTDTPPQSNVIYYYWVTAYAGAVESSRASGATGGINNTSCDASLTSSGKDIVSVNQVANSTSDCSTTSQFPANVQFKAGDVIGYGFKLCNYPTGQPLQGVNAATSVVINDTMTNLERYDKAYPLTDPRAWNASVTSGISINKIEIVSANEPNRIQLKITLNGSVAGNSTEKLFLYAKTAMPTGYSGSSSRFQDSMQLTYVVDQAAGTPGTTVTKSTPLLLFVKPQAPTKTETSP